jgi:predicted nucleotidyltransferase
MDKKEIIEQLKELKPIYEQEGLILIGLFGSYANNTQNQFSDLDIAYRLDYDKFSISYKDGFSKLLRIDAIKKELQDFFKIKVDLVSDANKNIVKGIEYV